jgi:ABC-type phosphate/phosphonate transport system permease subunit
VGEIHSYKLEAVGSNPTLRTKKGGNKWDLVLIAAGAILVWAVHFHTTAVNLHTIGWILLVVGLVLGLFELSFTQVLFNLAQSTRDDVRRFNGRSGRGLR